MTMPLSNDSSLQLLLVSSSLRDHDFWFPAEFPMSLPVGSSIEVCNSQLCNCGILQWSEIWASCQEPRLLLRILWRSSYNWCTFMYYFVISAPTYILALFPIVSSLLVCQRMPYAKQINVREGKGSSGSILKKEIPRTNCINCISQ